MNANNSTIKILIPNATGPTNMGDQAVLSGLLDILERNFPKGKITVHSTDPAQYPRQRPYVVRHTLYSWAVFDKPQFFTRLQRFIQLFVAMLSLKLGLNLKKIVVNPQLSRLVSDYLKADIIVFAGGGYLRSKKGLFQSLNLLMQLVMFFTARLVTGRKVVAPISFGPFAYNWQAKVTAFLLKDFDVIAAREAKSYEMLKLFVNKNLVLSNDTALLIKKTVKNRIKKTRKTSVVLGFTVRNWLNDKSKQDHLEQVFAKAITLFSRGKRIVVQPIIQATSPLFYSEDDARSVNRVAAQLRSLGLDTRTPLKVLSIDHALRIYGQLDLLLGMRMHSNILAAIHGVPFIAVSYEHKTEGIAKQISMERYCISCDQVDETSLYKLLLDAYKNKNQIRKNLLASIRDIRNHEMSQWRSLLVAV